MPKYYEGEAIVKAFTETTNQSATWARGILASMKEADVAPVVHGHWKKNRDRKEATCSVCTLLITDDIGDIEKLCRYCPSCGSKMDEEVVEI